MRSSFSSSSSSSGTSSGASSASSSVRRRSRSTHRSQVTASYRASNLCVLKPSNPFASPSSCSHHRHLVVVCESSASAPTPNSSSSSSSSSKPSSSSFMRRSCSATRIQNSGAPLKKTRAAKNGDTPAATTTASDSMDVSEGAHPTAQMPAPCTLGEPCIVDWENIDTPDAPPKLPQAFTKGTHIVCTLGPSTRSVEECEALLNAGMSVARFNFSHGSHDYHQETLDNLRAACKIVGRVCGILLDTKGPEVRTGYLEESLGGKVTYEMGSTITVSAADSENAKGNASLIAVSYENVAESVRPGSKILLADGSLMLEVKECHPETKSVTATCLNTATVGERKNCNLPGAIVDLPVLTEKDRGDLLKFGIPNEVDFIAASFVRRASDVHEIRDCLGEAGKNIKIISKIENQEGLDNLDAIIEASDGIMVARGDLGMEIPLERMFHVQKDMIHKCNVAGKPVVTATQMLESMINNPRPTRAEATDVANSVLDGTDCVMLSGETAAGKFPVEAVKIMASICAEAEVIIDNRAVAAEMEAAVLEISQDGYMDELESIASSAASMATKIGATAVVCLAATGYAARLVAKYRPGVPIVVGVVPPGQTRETIGFQSSYSGDQVARQLKLTRHIIPTVLSSKSDAETPAEAATSCVIEASTWAKEQGICKQGDRVVALFNVDRRAAVLRIFNVP